MQAKRASTSIAAMVLCLGAPALGASAATPGATPSVILSAASSAQPLPVSSPSVVPSSAISKVEPSPAPPPSGPSFERLKVKLEARSSNDWDGFEADGSHLTLVRFVRVPIGFHSRECSTWRDATATVPERGASLSPGWEGWGTFESSEIHSIQDCRSIPCSIKLDEDEILKMAGTLKDKRLARYFELIQKRLDDYRKDGVRRATEFPGALMAGAVELSQRGVFLPTFKNLAGWKLLEDDRLRVLPFDSGEHKSVRQALHWRWGLHDQDAFVLGEDIYTNHYFDSWSEYLEVRCVPPDVDPGRVEVTQALFIDLDLLKNTDLFSRLGRPKMRAEVQKEGLRLMKATFEALRIRAEELTKIPEPVPTPTAVPTPTPTPSPSVSLEAKPHATHLNAVKKK